MTSSLRYLIVLSLWVITILVSCVSPKRLYYFHNQVNGKDTIIQQWKEAMPSIQPGDRLNVVVSCPDPTQTSFLNPFNQSNAGNSSGPNNSGYLIDAEGRVDFPLLGLVKLSGLTSHQAADLLKSKLAKYYKDPYVYVSLFGRVHLLTPSGGAQVTIANERLTIFEALAQSGNQNFFERKHKVWVVREQNGSRSYAQVNLNDKSVFSSPYYYLRNNDLVYVQPSRFATFFSANSPGRNILAALAALTGLLFVIQR